MKNAKEFMDDFMMTIENMKKYQGIDILDPTTYDGNHGIVEEAFNLERNVIATVEPVEIIEENNILEEPPKILRLEKK